jgi:hypothetical protein
MVGIEERNTNLDLINLSDLFIFSPIFFDLGRSLNWAPL